jgi:hypothetical protein
VQVVGEALVAVRLGQLLLEVLAADFARGVLGEQVVADGAAFRQRDAGFAVFDEGRFAGGVAGEVFEGLGGADWVARVVDEFVFHGKLLAKEEDALALRDAEVVNCEDHCDGVEGD